MKAISLWQPWASALFAPLSEDTKHYLKGFETRHWPMPPRFIGQSIAIHAAKRDTKDEKEFWLNVVMDPEHREKHGDAFRKIGIRKYSDLPRGCIVGIVRFGASIETEEIVPNVLESEGHWGNYTAGRFAWPVLECQHFATPIPCVGMQGFFEVSLPTQSN